MKRQIVLCLAVQVGFAVCAGTSDVSSLPVTVVYVDAANGDDAGDGSAACPFRTPDRVARLIYAGSRYSERNDFAAK